MNEFLNENKNIDLSIVNSSPKIFSNTIYRLPTLEELEDLNKFDLSSEDIVNGFGYTIIGRGIRSKKNKQMIIDSIKMLIDLYPENDNYKDALLKAEKLKIK
jgi:hypothetical protein